MMEIKRPKERKSRINKSIIKKLLKRLLIVAAIGLIFFFVQKKLAEYKSNTTTALFGLHFVAGDFTASSGLNYDVLEYRNIMIDGTSYEVSVLPVKINALNNNSVVVAYADKMGRIYNFSASAFLIFNKLIVLPWSSDDYQDINQNRQFDIFDIDYIKGRVQVTKRGKSINLNSVSQTYKFVHLEGNASSDEDIYNEIRSIKINYDPHYNILYDCEIYFADGSYAIDPTIVDCDIENSRIKVAWETLMSLCNGDYYEHEKSGEITVYYLDTTPVGFIIIDDDNRMFTYQASFSNKIDAN